MKSPVVKRGGFIGKRCLRKSPFSSKFEMNFGQVKKRVVTIISCMRSSCIVKIETKRHLVGQTHSGCFVDRVVFHSYWGIHMLSFDW